MPKNDEHRVLMESYAAMTGRKQDIISSYDEALASSPSAKVVILTPDAVSICQQAKETFSSEEFNIILGSPDPYFIEFLRADISKASALRNVTAQFGINLKEVVAFGDGDNDKEMLQAAGASYAMKNGKAPAKEAAKEVLEVIISVIISSLYAVG